MRSFLRRRSWPRCVDEPNASGTTSRGSLTFLQTDLQAAVEKLAALEKQTRQVSMTTCTTGQWWLTCDRRPIWLRHREFSLRS